MIIKKKKYVTPGQQLAKAARPVPLVSSPRPSAEVKKPDAGKVTVRFSLPAAAPAPTDTEALKRQSMQQLWHSRLPKLNCNNCQLAQQCEAYKPGYECAWNRFVESHEIESEADVLTHMKQMVKVAMMRAQRMLITESVTGSAPTLETSEALSHSFAQAVQLLDRLKEYGSVTVEGDGTIIGQLFGGLSGLASATRESLANGLGVVTAPAVQQQVVSGELAAPQVARATVDPELVRLYAESKRQKPTEEEL